MDDLVLDQVVCNHSATRAQRTVLNAVRVAIHRAFAPAILKDENCSAVRAMAGWMSPLAALTGFGRPKCEKMRSPRAWFFPAWSTTDPCAAFAFSAAFAEGVAGGLNAASETRPALLLVAPAPPAAGASAAGLPPCFPAAPPVAAALAAFAARCFSCSSRRSCFVLLEERSANSREGGQISNQTRTSLSGTSVDPQGALQGKAHSEDALLVLQQGTWILLRFFGSRCVVRRAWREGIIET